MKIYHLNCGTMCAFGFLLDDDTGGFFKQGHCAVALRLSDRWLLVCGDAYGFYRQVDPAQPYVHSNGQLMETLVTTGFNIPRRH